MRTDSNKNSKALDGKVSSAIRNSHGEQCAHYLSPDRVQRNSAEICMDKVELFHGEVSMKADTPH